MRDVTDHADLEVLSTDECFDLLASEPVGRVAFIADGDPQIFPITYLVADNRILFRSGEGTKLNAAAHARRVAFEVDSYDAVNHRGWSVVANGHARLVDDDERVQGMEDHLEPWVEAARANWIEILVDDISGRRIPD